MSTAQVTASPRAPRGKQHPAHSATAQAPQSNNGRQGQRRPRGGRAANSGNQHSQAGMSPVKAAHGADPTLAESAVFTSEEVQYKTGPRNPKKHTQSQPSVDRIFSPPGALASLTDTEGAPLNPISSTPAKNQGAYAGPTFHASPAPSALPIPKFLSRSVPAKSRMDPPTPPPEDSSDSNGSPSPLAASPSRASIPVPSRNHDSPLDLLFKADRAERAKHINGSPASNNFFSPTHSARPHHYKQDSYGSLNAPFPIELDGESKISQMSPPPVASPMVVRSVTDPNKVPQLRDSHQSPPNNNDVMQDLLSRLSMSQKKVTAATPPRVDAQISSNPQPPNGSPSPFHDGRSAVRSASGPTTPVPAAQEPSDFFYGNRNLSPLFKAAKGDSSKRNSGLRTEITADSPLVAQGMFQDLPSVSSPRAMDPNSYSHNYPVCGAGVPAGPRRGSVPHTQPYRETPNNPRRTPGRPVQQPRHHSHNAKNNTGGPNVNSGKAGINGAPASVKKPATSMMSFVPSSVAAKKHSSSAPSTAAGPLTSNTSASSDTLALEQDLKRMLNLNSTGDTSGFR
jgi:hypothetical protein